MTKSDALQEIEKRKQRFFLPGRRLGRGPETLLLVLSTDLCPLCAFCKGLEARVDSQIPLPVYRFRPVNELIRYFALELHQPG